MVATTVSGPRGRGTSSAAILVMAGLLAGITSQLAFEGGVSGTSLNKAFGEAGHRALRDVRSSILKLVGTHWQLTVDDQGNAVWTAARSAGAEGPDTDRARDLKLSASVDVSELFVPSSVRAVIRNCPMELDEAFLTAPPGERPPLPGDKEEGQECRAFHPAAVKAFKIQTRLNATTIAQDEAKKADQVEAVERSAAVLHEFQGGAIDGGGDGGLLLKNLDLALFREKLLDKLGADWGRPTPELLQAQTTAEEAKAKHQARQAKGALETRMLEPITPPFSAWPSEVRVAIETGVFEPTAVAELGSVFLPHPMHFVAPFLTQGMVQQGQIQDAPVPQASAFANLLSRGAEPSLMLVLHLGDVEGLHNALQAPLLELGALKASQEPLDVLGLQSAHRSKGSRPPSGHR